QWRSKTDLRRCKSGWQADGLVALSESLTDGGCGSRQRWRGGGSWLAAKDLTGQRLRAEPDLALVSIPLAVSGGGCLAGGGSNLGEEWLAVW
ncbi:hypothetical protein Dimus_033147, partial [Dionaea muscipula]